MKVSDLMIGDWVAAKGIDKPFRVLYITYSAMKEQLCIFGKTSDGIRVGPFLSKEIQPISLTPEILKKNGFVYSDIPFEQSWQQFGLSIWGTMGNYHISCGMNISMDVSNVHELQHAMKLCNIDKENVL